MAPQTRPALGFTLIEVMITLTILSLVMLSGAAVFNFMAQNWQRNQVTYERSLERYEDWSLVSKSAANIVPKIVMDENRLSGFYFLGRVDGFTAVTQVAVQAPEYPAVFRLFREPSETGNGWQLVYEEAVLDQVILRVEDQQLPFNFRRVIATELNEVEFEYYGWENLDQRLRQDTEFGEGMSPQWFDEYDGVPRRQHPLVIQIHIEDFLWPIVVTDISGEIMERTIDEGL